MIEGGERDWCPPIGARYVESPPHAFDYPHQSEVCIFLAEMHRALFWKTMSYSASDEEIRMLIGDPNGLRIRLP